MFFIMQQWHVDIEDRSEPFPLTKISARKGACMVSISRAFDDWAYEVVNGRSVERGDRKTYPQARRAVTKATGLDIRALLDAADDVTLLAEVSHG